MHPRARHMLPKSWPRRLARALTPPSARGAPWLAHQQRLSFRAVFLSVMFTSFLCMMPCVASMAMGHVGMMPRLFMSSTLMMLGGFTMVVSRMLMMLSC
jgi:hypothetical protein